MFTKNKLLLKDLKIKCVCVVYYRQPTFYFKAHLLSINSLNSQLSLTQRTEKPSVLSLLLRLTPE